MKRVTSRMTLAIAFVVATSCAHDVAESRSDGAARAPTVEEHARTIDALRPPKRARPLIAILADNAGTETTDFIVPYGVLTESGVADVVAVAPESAPIQLMPALAARPQQTTAAFDAVHPTGADYVVVPAMHRSDSPEILRWVRAQASSGAMIVGICSGALVLAEAGLLADRAATTHWFDIEALERNHPTLRRVRDRRYVVDGNVVTTTGVTASVPVSLALVEAIGGRAIATDLARRIGADADWSARHSSAAFELDWRTASTGIANVLAFWRHETIGIPVADGIDEIALALAADAYSRTYRSKAIATASSESPVRSKRGLVLVPDRMSDSSEFEVTVDADANALPVHALEGSLEGIRARYDDDTAAFVALQLEYAWP